MRFLSVREVWKRGYGKSEGVLWKIVFSKDGNISHHTRSSTERWRPDPFSRILGGPLQWPQTEAEPCEGLLRWLSGKESARQCRACGFDLWVGKIPWRRRWQPTPVFLPGKSHRQRSLAGYSSWAGQDSDMT